jgi:spore germination cell wall hydrolase CwlJ-like protein
MSFRRTLLLCAAGTGLIGAIAAPAAPGFAFQTPVPASQPVASVQTAVQSSETTVETAAPQQAASDEAPALPTAPQVSASDPNLICLAKIVHHEAANQPRRGQIAVAEVVMNRLASPRFPKSVCAIARQRGQFFNVDAYHPERDPRWHTAVQVAEDAMNGDAPQVVGNALFFHTASSSGSFVGGRQMVARIGGHIFYR